MRLTGNILLIMLLFGSAGMVAAAEVPLRHYSPETILIQSQVNEIVQDSRGVIWVGTMGGINLFTGANVYTLTYTNGLESEWIRSFSEATPNTMWIGTNAGLGYISFDVTDSVHFLPKTREQEVRGVAAYQGELYVGTLLNGLCVLQDDTLLVVPGAALPEGSLLLDLIQWQNALWLATSTGLYRWNGTTLKGEAPDIFFLKLVPSSTGLWCGSSSGLFLKNTKGLRRIIGNEVVTDVAVRGDSVAASLYYTGIVRFNQHTPKRREIITAENGLPDSFFRSVYLDRQGSLWVGTDGEGLVQVLPYQLRAYTEKSGLANPMVNHIARIGDRLLVATDDGIYHSGNDEQFERSTATKSARAWCISPFIDNRVVVGYDNSTDIYEMDNDGNFISEQHLLDFAVLDVLNKDGQVWLGTEKGLRLYHADGHWEVFPSELGFSSMYCHALADAGDGLYIATDRGLNYFNQRRVQIWEASRVIWDVAVDLTGKIWLGTDAGLIVLNQNGERLAWYNLEDGLPGSNVYSVSIRPGNEVWLGTNQGIVRLEDQFVEVLGYDDGLPANEMNNGAIMAEASGVWFGSIGGLIHIPTGMDLPEHVPTVVPYQFWQDGQPTAGWAEKYSHNHPLLTVDLGAPDFLNRTTEFRYRFLNRPGDWVGLGANTQLQFSNLSPGEYEIGVQARGVGHLDWGPVYRFSTFVINPPFYQRWEFLVAVLLVSVVFFSRLTYRIVQIRHEREIMQWQAEEIALAEEFNQQLANTELPTVGKNWKLSVVIRPRNEFSGDFYYTFRGRDERFFAMVVDVAGSGLETSYLNGFLKMSLQSQDWKEMTLSGWLEQMNLTLYRLPKAGFNVAVTAAVVNEETDLAYCMAAGNPPPFIVDKSGIPHTVKTPSAPPMGVFADWSPAWQTITLPPGSMLGLHSDGLHLIQDDTSHIAPLHTPDVLGCSADQTLQTLMGTGWMTADEDDRLLVTINRLEKPINQQVSK
ncbi:MAG: SpoIIE family protein phosphatase [Lentisphaeria bacterium]|nr:SpoIIE family protein phosphatase [Candidatus Neomarinimicrobiota bacterium]MCF7842773.1 SpoIIE family protein phosphatase [Lentisphaeria bacterium]